VADADRTPNRPDVPRPQGPQGPGPQEAAQPARGFREGARRATAAAAIRTGDAARASGRRIRRATSAQGAGESGLAHLIELHAVNSAGDMLITVALASTIFFSVPTGQARDRVALYLLVTMAPFVLLAPVIGPMLDRLPSGRRAAMATAMLARAMLAWTMAGSVRNGGLALYPEALGVLVASKAYGVVRSVVVPRLRPPGVTLVKANSRVTLAGLIATALAGGLGGALHFIGPDWPLRAAFLVFIAGTLLSFSLPRRVDTPDEEAEADVTEADVAGPADAEPPGPPPRERLTARIRRGWQDAGPAVRLAIGAEGSLRALSGFLTFFFAFLLREHPVGGLPGALALALAAGALGAGNMLGTVIGSWLRSRGPELTVTAMLAAATAALAAATAWYVPITVVLAAGVAGIAQSLGKVALDALIQRDVPERVRTSAFARSETLMQLGWVLGGGLGIALPLIGRLGTGTAAALLAACLLLTLRGLRRLPHRRLPAGGTVSRPAGDTA
jgi:MFS family permease